LAIPVPLTKTLRRATLEEGSFFVHVGRSKRRGIEFFIITFGNILERNSTPRKAERLAPKPCDFEKPTVLEYSCWLLTSQPLNQIFKHRDLFCSLEDLSP
jgi:hypothetical protein